ncbi:predicted protein [Aspergillus nidulans FGSC A4]|uniref:Uncharacterized protein n=1 Tax=Emericella nidulans (strain FGSC A4 / ATCC 38163 / CBS 112.46 / NRRL 194 / M139) TaxID=227321 RepID=Q5B8Q4_EMENI|nr:hypothetical protein [Aspergillus nidulans FGSC A4]EAA63647.1 predicted protein [Aspergillus nidulans FGSC A4]CBF83451.1 TPA: conserved hypothetical protein [Aspergillus nidulans FGSC A4]|eukprot:XP_660680.1 predicted protein [Aspergillus nidulans FGSC A4]
MSHLRGTEQGHNPKPTQPAQTPLSWELRSLSAPLQSLNGRIGIASPKPPKSQDPNSDAGGSAYSKDRPRPGPTPAPFFSLVVGVRTDSIQLSLAYYFYKTDRSTAPGSVLGSELVALLEQARRPPLEVTSPRSSASYMACITPDGCGMV